MPNSILSTPLSHALIACTAAIVSYGQPGAAAGGISAATAAQRCCAHGGAGWLVEVVASASCSQETNQQLNAKQTTMPNGPTPKTNTSHNTNRQPRT